MTQWVKNLPAAGDTGLIPGLQRSLGERNGNPLQYSYLGSPMDREAWQATVQGVAKSQTQLSDYHFLFSLSPREGQRRGGDLLELTDKFRKAAGHGAKHKRRLYFSTVALSRLKMKLGKQLHL